jgi:pyrophosphatase PpaX
MKPRPDAVLFDLDGTLVDTGTLIKVSADRTMREVLGVVAPGEELLAAVGIPLYEQFDRIARAVVLGTEHERPTGALYDRGPLESLSGEADTQVRGLRCRLIDRYSEINYELHDEYIKPFPGIAELLATIAEAGLPIGVVTSKRRFAAESDVAFYGLDTWVEKLVAADDLPWHKPDPRPVLYGLQLLATGRGVEVYDPAHCVYVGDSPFDIQAGRKAGTDTVGVTWGLFSEDVLRAENPGSIAHSTTELCSILLPFSLY